MLAALHRETETETDGPAAEVPRARSNNTWRGSRYSRTTTDDSTAAQQREAGERTEAEGEEARLRATQEATDTAGGAVEEAGGHRTVRPSLRWRATHTPRGEATYARRCASPRVCATRTGHTKRGGRHANAQGLTPCCPSRRSRRAARGPRRRGPRTCRTCACSGRSTCSTGTRRGASRRRS